MVKFGENMGPKQLDPHQRQSGYAGCADGWELLTDTKIILYIILIPAVLALWLLATTTSLRQINDSKLQPGCSR